MPVILLSPGETREFDAPVTVRRPGGAIEQCTATFVEQPGDFMGDWQPGKDAIADAADQNAATIGRILKGWGDVPRRRGDEPDSDAARLTESDFDRLPEIIAHPQAVLLDNGAKPSQGTVLLYVFEPDGPAGSGKIVVEMDFAAKAPGRSRVTSNAVRTAGYLQPADLRAQRYEVLYGSVGGDQ